MKSESLSLLEPSGPVQAYTGIALPIRKKYKELRSGEFGAVPSKLNVCEHTPI